LNIAIAGAGIAGAYLYRLLSKSGNRVDIYDVPHETSCGMAPCAWGTSNGFSEIVKASGLDPDKYTLRHVDHLWIDQEKIEVALMTIDKPDLIKDLLQGADIKYSPLEVKKYDRIIDATGLSRKFLPRIIDDILVPCIQYRVQSVEHLENRIKPGGIGYAWCFPLSGNRYHIGCSSLFGDLHRIFKELGWLETTESKSRMKIICGCESRLRLTGPHDSLPFVSDGPTEGIWGIGEAIGCVGPFAGDGIVPAMKSARILMDNWDDPDGYTKEILKEFIWMNDERKVIDKLLKRGQLDIGDAWLLKKNSKRVGMKIGIKQAESLIKRIRLTQA